MPQVITERPNGRLRVQLRCDDPTRTEQSHKNKVNINSIMAKARKRGIIPQVSGGSYGDFTSELDYHQTLSRIRSAETSFMKLPANIRNRFKNDPGKMLEFLNDGKNLQEALDLGLLQDLDGVVDGKVTVITPNPDDPVPPEGQT